MFSDLSCRSDLQLRPTQLTGEPAMGGVPRDIMVRMTAYDRPPHFCDETTRPPFQQMKHDHEFTPDGGTMVIQDVLRFASPCRVSWGRLSDRTLFLPHLRSFFEERNRVVKGAADPAF